MGGRIIGLNKQQSLVKVGSLSIVSYVRPVSMLILDPICSMYGIFTNMYPINHPNVGKYTIHGAFGDG